MSRFTVQRINFLCRVFLHTSCLCSFSPAAVRPALFGFTCVLLASHSLPSYTLRVPPCFCQSIHPSVFIPVSSNLRSADLANFLSFFFFPFFVFGLDIQENPRNPYIQRKQHCTLSFAKPQLFVSPFCFSGELHKHRSLEVM